MPTHHCFRIPCPICTRSTWASTGTGRNKIRGQKFYTAHYDEPSNQWSRKEIATGRNPCGEISMPAQKEWTREFLGEWVVTEAEMHADGTTTVRGERKTSSKVPFNSMRTLNTVSDENTQLRAEVKDLRDALTELRDFAEQESEKFKDRDWFSIWEFYDKVQEHILATLDGEVEKDDG